VYSSYQNHGNIQEGKTSQWEGGQLFQKAGQGSIWGPFTD